MSKTEQQKLKLADLEQPGKQSSIRNWTAKTEKQKLKLTDLEQLGNQGSIRN